MADEGPISISFAYFRDQISGEKNVNGLKHCASIDLEDWYFDVEHVVPSDNAAFAKAFDRQLNRIESILDEAGVRCTFFALGRTVERYPQWIKRLHAAGHEIASHGHGHEVLPRLNPASFRADVRRSLDVVADLIGTRPQGYRAPYFSLGSAQSWAYEILAGEGLRYSSSVLPFRADRGDARPLSPVRITTASGTVVEMPASVIELAGRRLPVAGGGFWRALPRVVIDVAARRIAREGRALVFYLHPHEFDPDNLRSHKGLGRNVYANLGRKSVAGKLRFILKRFQFVPMSVLVAGLGSIPESRVVK
jgi:polysaccharide deacetylase family protein (PEP-CTERM system associated)